MFANHKLHPVETVKKASDIVDSSSGAFSFFSDWHDQGFWYASTGQHFGPWLHDVAIQALSFSDCLIFVGVVLVFLSIAGSKRARKWLWWDFILYFVMNAISVWMQLK